jgi:hypothetical protein
METKMEKIKFNLRNTDEEDSLSDFYLGQINMLREITIVLTNQRDMEQKGSLPYRVIDLMISKINEV